MAQNKAVSIQLTFCSGALTEFEIEINGPGFEGDGIRCSLSEHAASGCRTGTLSLEISPEREGLADTAPVRMRLPLEEEPEKITVLYQYSPFWTRPAFPASPAEIPDRTQTALFRLAEGVECLLPLTGESFRTWVSGGGSGELHLTASSGTEGIHVLEEPVYLITRGPSAAEAVHAAASRIAEAKGILPRSRRTLPEMFRFLGWCSWDSLHTDVTEQALRLKAEELAQKQVPVRWMLIDDGWLSTEDRKLCAFEPDRSKFPRGFLPMIRELQASTSIRWFGAWHDLGGYWEGIAPGSALALQEADHLIQTAEGSLLPSPVTGAGFYEDWYRLLRKEGIDFVKVDDQSSAAARFAHTMPAPAAARGLSQAMEAGGCWMNGAILNCMGMAMENLVARPSSAVSRSSDDFRPEQPESFREHLLQNAYNALLQDEFHVCDWDMFWTEHPRAAEHALLRAVSGGPVYFSDRTGATDPGILKPLIYPDGELLMMERGARPSEDCVFSDPEAGGVLKLQNAGPWGTRRGGGIAVFNMTDSPQSFSLSPSDIPELAPAGRCWVYDFFGRKVCSLDRGERLQGRLDRDGFGWYVLLPSAGRGVCLGLVDKYAGFTAVEHVSETENCQITVLRASGRTGWIWETPPRRVSAGGRDLTQELKQDGMLFTLDLPEVKEQTVLAAVW